MKIQKAIWVGPWPFFYLFETGPIDRYCCWPVFPFYPAAAILSHARPGNITTADPHAAIVSFFFFPFLFSSHRQPTNEIVVGVTFSSLCVRIVLSLAHAWAIGLLFSPAGQHATRMYEQSHGSLVWVRVVCALNYGRGKTFDASTFSLGKHFLSLFLSPHFDYYISFLLPANITLCQLAASWTPYRMCVCQKTPAEMNIKNSRGNGPSSEMRRRIHFIIPYYCLHAQSNSHSHFLYTCLAI